MTEFLTGIRFLFAALFVGTAVLKLRGIARFELVLLQLFGTAPFTRTRVSSRTAAVALAGFELLLAAVIGLGLAEPVSTAVLLLTMIAFGAVVWRAWRLHVDCGCFPDRRPAEVSSLVRSALLIALAATLLVGGIPPIAGAGEALAGVAWTAFLAAGVYAVFRVVQAVVRRRYPGESQPRMVPVPIVAEVLAARGTSMPAGLADGQWVEVVALCSATRLPVSTLFAELERRSRSAAPPLLPVGTRIERPTTDLVAPTVVALFSATCTRCPTHVPHVVEHLQRHRPPPGRVLVAVSGDGPGAQRFVDAFGELATVVVEPDDGPFTSAFRVRQFPVYYVLDADGTITDAANHIDDLAPVTA